MNCIVRNQTVSSRAHTGFMGRRIPIWGEVKRGTKRKLPTQGVSVDGTVQCRLLGNPYGHVLP